MPPTPYTPAISAEGGFLVGELWFDQIITPLIVESCLLSLPGLQVHQTDVALHIPILHEGTTDETVWAAPNDAVAEVEGTSAELVLMGRSLRACKILVRVSSESFRSSDTLQANQVMLVNQIRKIVDKALLQGDSTAGIVGLIPSAGTTIKHSRTVDDGVTATSTALTSATAAFTSADVGSTVTGAGIPDATLISSVTNATTVVLSHATTATASGVTFTITSAELVYDHFVDALTQSQDNFANPTHWIINSQTIGALRKLKDTLGRPQLSPDTTVQGADALLGRTIVPASSAVLPHGTALLVDPRCVHAAVDLQGYVRLAMEAFIANDQIGLLVSSRFDAGVTIPAGLIAITGLGPN